MADELANQYELRRHLMAHPGEVVAHPAGLRITFLETADQTNGDRLRLDVVMPPRFSVAEHYHPWQMERHRVLSGTLRGRVGGQERDYKSGEEAVGPANVPHAWRNPSDHEDLRIVTEHGPVGHIELMFEAGVPIVRELTTDKKHALRHVLRLAVLADAIKDEVIYTGMRMRAVMALLVAVAPIGRWFGYRMDFKDVGGHVAAARSEVKR
jgi:quercetin dioxygenase-like cupin family protein